MHEKQMLNICFKYNVLLERSLLSVTVIEMNFISLTSY